MDLQVNHSPEETEHAETVQVKQPLNMLTSLPELCMVDFRGIHDEPNMGYWTEEKCSTMRHISTLTKALKRRRFSTKVHIDVS